MKHQKRTTEKTSAGIWRILAVGLVSLLAALAVFSASGQQVATVHFDLDANPRVVDEGDLIEFEILNTRYYDPETGDLMDLPPVVGDIVWNYDDGSGEASAPDFHSSHRFSDNRVGDYEVSARILNSRYWVKVKVENVAPEIYDISRTRPAMQQTPIEFQAHARDPGIDDELTFNWTFGDGGTGAGQTVTHTYAENGTYQVTVEVDDGDGGTDSRTITVPVGNVGSFTVSGVPGIGTQEIENVVLAATSPNPFQRQPTDPCLFQLTMYGEEEGASFALSANLIPGLGQRDYTIGTTTEWAGMHQDEGSNPGTFFAVLGLPRDIGIRDFNGKMVGGAFRSRGGTVKVDYFDGNYFEMQFSARLLENIPASFGPRYAFVNGVIAMSIKDVQGESQGEMLSAVAGSRFYFCGRAEGTFDIADRKPVAEAVNVDFLNPEIEVTFSEKVDPNTISENMVLEYKGKTGFEKVPGSWRPIPADPTGVEFIPQARLKHGTIHCVRVNTAEDGVRGQQGESLEPAADPLFSETTQPGCDSGSMEFGMREWAFSTRPEFSSAKVDVYQASVAGDGTPLVPGKPAVSRVYVDWPEPADVHTTGMVKSIPARVTLLAHNDSPVYAPEPKAIIKRPDLHTAEDKKNANNTVNFYNWRPIGSGGMSVRAKIEPLDENDEVVTEFEGSKTELVRDSRAPSLKFDYHFLKLNVEYAKICEKAQEPQCETDCDNSEGSGGEEACVNACLSTCVTKLNQKYGSETDLSRDFSFAQVTEGDRLTREGALFTTQNFPVLETRGRPKGQTELDVPLYSNLSIERQAAWGLYLTGWQSDADILVGLVQPGVLPSTAVGMMVPWGVGGQRVVLMEVGKLNVQGVAHEFGHFYNLKHCPENPAHSDIRKCPPPNPQIQGFRISASGETGFNKHGKEGNQQSGSLVPLMSWVQSSANRSFIKKADYLALFDNIADAPAATEPGTWFDPSPGPLDAKSILASLLLPQSAFAQGAESSGLFVAVSGVVTSDAILLESVNVRSSVRQLPVSRDGTFLLEFLDETGAVLGETRFDVISPDPWHGAEDGDTVFHVVKPAPDGLAAVRVSGPGLTPVTRERSSSPPTVSAETSSGPGGELILNWTVSDSDGDTVVADIYLHTADEAETRAIIIGTSRTVLNLAPEDLPPGERITARIEVSDGFNTSVAEVDLGAGPPPRIMSTSPADGEEGVAKMLDVTAWVSGPLAESEALVIALPKGSFRLVNPDGEEVFADVAYQPGTDTLTLTPVQPLSSGTRYTATIEGLQDIWGHSMAEPMSWQFTTAGGSEKPLQDSGVEPSSQGAAADSAAARSANAQPRSVSPARLAPVSSPAVSAGSSSGDLMSDDLTQSVQNHLLALGYDPGNTDGELSTDTVIAISQFQAERSMEITGEVTPQLLGILAAEVDAR